MPLKEATFWWGTIVGGTGIYFWVEGGDRLIPGIVLTIVGVLMSLYAVVAHHYPNKFPRPRLWAIAFILSWAALSFDIYERNHPISGWAWLFVAGIAVCATAAIWALSQFLAARLPKTPQLEIFVPTDQGAVGLFHTIRGSVYPPNSDLQVLVIPGDGWWYLQGPVKVNGASWSNRSQFGTPKPIRVGSSFKIVALLGKHVTEERIRELPANVPRSNEVHVRRTHDGDDNEQPAKKSKLKIHRARWGAAQGPQGAEADVTENLIAIAGDALVLDVYYKNPALGDPAPMKLKRLDIDYSYGNEIVNAHVSRWERGDKEISRLVLPEDSEIKRLETELEKAKLRAYPRPVLTVERVFPEGPATSPTVLLKNKIRIILTNHSDRDVCVWTPLWESSDVRADGNPPGSTLQLAKRQWEFDEWENENTCITVPIGHSFRSYIALLPTVGESIYHRFETKIPLGTLVFPVKIDGKLYEIRKNI